MATDQATASWLKDVCPEGIIDGYVNLFPPDPSVRYEKSRNVFASSMARAETVDELVESMDRFGVAWALLAPPPETALADVEAGYRMTYAAVQRHPTRFGLSARVDPNQGMTAVRQLEAMVRNDGLVALRFAPYRIGKPPNDKVYYPLFAKCVELDLPVTVLSGVNTTSMAGGQWQDPIYLDEVCAFWPELVIVTAHGARPWTELLVMLMSKWPNLHHMISAYAPHRYPQDTLDFLNSSRGREKVMFGTDYPLISFARAASELPRAGIKPDSLPYFLHHNADRVFRKRRRDG